MDLGSKSSFFWLRLILEIIGATVGFGNERTREGGGGRGGARLETLSWVKA